MQKLLAALIIVLTSLVPTTTATANTTNTTNTPGSYNGLARTPPMGFNDWQYYRCDINEKTITATAKALVTSGLARHGYDDVNVDDCWLASTRDANGNLQANSATFPHGIAWLAHYVHSLGLKFGIYEDGGYRTCGGYPGMYQHFQQDANTFAGWGVDFLKLDYCNQPTDKYPGKTAAQVAKIVYSQVSQALLNTHRKIVFSESAPAYFCCSGPDFADIMSWVGSTGNLWRFGDDIQDNWSSIITNYTEDNTPGLAHYAGPGHWNDPDMLLAGTNGVTATEQQSQLSLWAEMAAPLLISANVPALSKQTVAMLSNPDVISIDQDRRGAQGTIVSSTANADVLAKPLIGGDIAVVLFNKASTAQTISTTAAAVGLPQTAGYRLNDVWAHHSTESRGTIAADVPAHGVVMYRVRPRAAQLPPALALSTTTGTWHAGTPTPVTVTLADDGSVGVTRPTATLTAPKGWLVRPARRTMASITPGGKVSAAFEVTPPRQPAGTTYSTLGISTIYRWRGRLQTVTGPVTAAIMTPYPSLAASYDNVGITDDATTNPPGIGAGIDDYSSTLSAEALTAAGAKAGGTLSRDGITFTWPSMVGAPNDTVATGQTINVSGSGHTLGFLDTAGFGPAGGIGTVTYTDGTTASFSLSAPDWTSPPAGTEPALSTPYHNLAGHNGPVTGQTDVYLSTVALNPAKTVRAVTLPTVTGGSGHSTLHIFAMSIA